MDISEVLRRPDLSGMDLSSYSLGGKDLRGKIFRGADLSHAHLGHADLRGADLRNANLYQANLGAANLSGADLRYSDLREANLTGAILTGTDLREAIGLDRVSINSISTLIKPITLEPTEDFLKAQKRGYFPLSHWGKSYHLDGGDTLYKNTTVWGRLKAHLGDTIFGDRKIFSEVKLVQQYKDYSQWAYMISRRGFEMIAGGLGIPVKQKKK